MPVALRYFAALALVAAATFAAFVVKLAVQPTELALVFVVPVAVAAAALGWGPALVASVASVLAFDFFFVPPFYTFTVASPSDLWALGLLLVVAALVSSVAAHARRRALDAREAADRAEALQSLAHAVIRSRPTPEIVHAAADSLSMIFKAPAVVLAKDGEAATEVRSSGAAPLDEVDREAAEWTLDSRTATRGDTYPFADAAFDFWPVNSPGECRYTLGVDFTQTADGRPDDADRLVELVAGYLAVAVGRDGAPAKPARRARRLQ